MKRSSPALLLALALLAACGGTEYRKIRMEIPSYSPLHIEQFKQAVFSGFIVGPENAGLDLNTEISGYFGPEFERKLRLEVSSRPVVLDSEELFRKPDFWKSLAPGSSGTLYVTGKAEMTKETRKTVLDAKTDPNDQMVRRKEFAERSVFSLNLHIYLIRGDSGEVLLDRDFKETKAYTGAKQRPDFAFYDLAQRVKTKLFRPILSEERMQERYLLLR
jgi:hypothetical protein